MNLTAQNRNIQMTTAHLPKNNFNWRKWIKIVLISAALFFLIMKPFLIGQILGTWLHKIVTGFTSAF